MKKAVILGLIVLLGFVLRVYNLDFPSIGYHNMKENENLCMAQEMERTKDFINKRVYFYNGFDDNPVVRSNAQPPLVPYHIILAWKVFGNNLWGPRLVNVLFGLLSICVIYLISRILFKDEQLSLFSAVVMAAMPLGVFFSRNLQSEAPAFFFMLLGNLFYLRFVSSFKKHELALGSLFVGIAWFYRFSFLVGVLPVLFCLPYKALYKERREFGKFVTAFVVPYAVMLVLFLWFRHLGQWEVMPQLLSKSRGLFDFFLPSYWIANGKILWWYMSGENFTIVFTSLALLGVILAVFKGGTLVNRYIMGWALSCIPYGMIYSGEMHRNNFAQMPFMAFICVASVLTVAFFSEELKKMLKKNLLIVLMALIMAIASFYVYKSLYKMFGVIFSGGEVAGESLKEFTSPEDRVFVLAHPQGNSVARYAQRYMGWPTDFDDFKNKEEKFGVKYACFYPGEFIRNIAAKDPDLIAYIEANYHVKEIGLSEGLKRLDYVILERGEGQKILEHLQSFSGSLQPRTIYKIFGKYIFFYAMRPKIEKADEDTGNK